jgi:hypothetical protein
VTSGRGSSRDDVRIQALAFRAGEHKEIAQFAKYAGKI